MLPGQARIAECGGLQNSQEAEELAGNIRVLRKHKSLQEAEKLARSQVRMPTKKKNSGKVERVTAEHREKLVQFKADFFKALANPLRIRILDELRSEELTVSEIRDRLDVEMPNVSQQLAVLKSKQLVIARKQGNNIYYSCVDPTVFELLDVAKQLFQNHLTDIHNALKQL